ncbi:hypothetical protein ACFYY8_31610 [Streptosporangium sp. NPDC001559]|uniref:hypothetical protein n=1 Tax=Streptosporangium sp. NPDC001559 TaxID=3366187 RepID=UPI0036E4C66E
MADYDLDGTDLLALLPYFEQAEREATNKAFAVVKDHAIDLRNAWRDNARSSSGRHGKHYPKSITAEQIPHNGAIEWEVGPETRLPQGGMGRGFEYGSANQPPHLDGAQAAAHVEPQFVKALDDIVRDLL